LPSKRPWSIVCMWPSLNKGLAFIGPQLLKGPQSIAYMGPSLKQKTMIYNLHGTITKKGIAIYSLQSKREKALQSKGRSKFTKVCHCEPFLTKCWKSFAFLASRAHQLPLGSWGKEELQKYRRQASNDIPCNQQAFFSFCFLILCMWYIFLWWNSIIL
jgi:hypothetical protein